MASTDNHSMKTPRHLIALLGAIAWLCSLLPGYAKEAEAPVAADRWAVENLNYGERWNVENRDNAERWGVVPKHFSDSLGESGDARATIINRGLYLDRSVVPSAADTAAGADAAKKKSSDGKSANKGSSGKKKPAQKKASSGQKKPADKKKVAAAKKSDKKKTAKAAGKSGGKQSSGKKGSYKKYTLTVKDQQREYYVYKPPGVKEGVKLPTVIAFHGFESDANGLRWLIKPDKFADQYKYMVIYPNAVKKSWNVGKGTGSKNKNTDDWAFSQALYKTVISRHPVDTNRLYVMGFSNGAQMTALWACRMADKIAAAAMVAHTMNIPDCKPSHTTPMALIHGMRDKLAPYKGGGKHKLASHADSVEFFKKVNGATSKKVAAKHGKTFKCDSWPNSARKTEVIDCKMYNDGHSWPGGVEFMVDVLGTTNKELNATHYLFHFFSKYKARPQPRKAPG